LESALVQASESELEPGQERVLGLEVGWVREQDLEPEPDLVTV
jgi:hypothetical protein